MDVLKIDNLKFSYENGRQIFSGINLHVESGECVGLIGANGMGKTTLLKLLTGLLHMTDGSIEVSGISLNKNTLKDIRQHIGYVFQDSDSQLFMTTVSEDIMFGPLNYGKTRAEAEALAEKAMELTNCAYLKDRQIHKLSGGEKKLAAIAAILAMEPEIIIMDEPTNALDPGNRRRLIHVLNSLSCSKLIASHDLDMIWDTCSRVVLLGKDGIIAEGPVKEILSNRTLLENNSLELPLTAELYQIRNKEYGR